MLLRRLETPELAERWTKERRRLPTLTAIGVWLWFGLVILIILFAITFWRWLYVAIPLCGTASMVCLIWSCRIEREVYRRLARVPPELHDRAYLLYRRDTYPWQCAAIECHECLLPGDCPLCGAT